MSGYPLHPVSKNTGTKQQQKYIHSESLNGVQRQKAQEVFVSVKFKPRHIFATLFDFVFRCLPTPLTFWQKLQCTQGQHVGMIVYLRSYNQIQQLLSHFTVGHLASEGALTTEGQNQTGLNKTKARRWPRPEEASQDYVQFLNGFPKD